MFFPEEPESAKKIIRAFQKIWNKNSTFAIANSSLQASLLQEKIPARVHYLKPIDYRFGEEKFIQLDLEISKFSPNLVLFFSKNHLPALYLARHSLAECRIGFEKNAYPFLNTFFSAQNLNEALSLLLEQYGENHGG